MEMPYGTNKVIRTNFFVDIQAEAINQNDDILYQILLILVHLTEQGILRYPKRQVIYDLMSFYHVNFNNLFALDRLDFYFDLLHDDMRLLGKQNTDHPNTSYSSSNSAVLKAYFREVKLKQKRHISYDAIENIDYSARIEFSLRRDNCNFLNIQNLSGTYDNVFIRYLSFLARKWHDYRYKVVEVAERNIDYAHHLRQIITVAGRQIPQYSLLETPPKPIPHKSVRRNETEYNFIAEFYGRS
jgi:hypothetical protein